MKALLLSLFILCAVSGLALGQDAGQLVLRAKASIEKKEYDIALADLTQAISAQKKNAEAFALRGDVYMAQKKIEPARLDYNQAIKLNPKTSAFYFKRGMSFKESPGYSREATMADLTKALDLDPANENALRERGFIYYVSDNLTAAVTDFEAALRLDPRDAPIYGYLARIHYKTNLDQALADYKSYLAIKADDPYAYVERGNIYEMQNKNDLALADYNKVIDLRPRDLIGYANRANLYVREKKYTLSIGDLSKMIELEPARSATYSRRALVYEVIGKYDLAIEDYDRALAINSSDPMAKERRPLLFEKFRALLPTAEATSAAFNLYLKNYVAKAAVFNGRSAEFFTISEAQQKLAKPDTKLMCEKAAELRALYAEVVLAFDPLRQMYDTGKLAGFSEAIDKVDSIIGVLERTDKGVREYEDFYKCKH